MLTSLHIENIAVIERADILFDKGFNVLTGETGAGKSIIIDSLKAVLGERIGREIIRTGCSGAAVSAIFSDISRKTAEALAEIGAEPDEDGALMLERRLSADGKASARLNGRPVTVAVLRAAGRMLLNIHGQHENQALLDSNTHLEYLDRLAGLEEIRDTYVTAYREYVRLRDELDSLDVDETLKARRMDLLRYQIDEIEGADLHPGEEEEVRARRDMFRNAEKIARSIEAARQFLSGDEEQDGALSLLQQAAENMDTAARYWNGAAETAEKIRSLQYELDACTDEVHALLESLELDEAAREETENRWELIRKLMSKYGGSAEEVLAFLASCKEEFEAMEFSDERKAALTKEVEKAEKRMLAAADSLTAARKGAAEGFARRVGEQLAFLDMPRAKLSVSVTPIRPGPRGADQVEFLLAANLGEDPRPLAKIASGGEMSRVMLALQSVLAKVNDIDTLVFDEIDAGVSGRAALKVGKKLQDTAAGDRQVLCVTHLAQIAARADHHLLIEKAVRDGRTYTQVTPLDEAGRERELARIIGGKVTETAIQAAKELRSSTDI